MPCEDVTEERRNETRSGKGCLRGERIATLVSGEVPPPSLLVNPWDSLCCRICRKTTDEAVILTLRRLHVDSGEGEVSVSRSYKVKTKTP